MFIESHSDSTHYSSDSTQPLSLLALKQLGRLASFANKFLSLPIAGVDYSSLIEMVTFETGVDRATVSVPISDDSGVEKDETFTAVLSGVHGTFITRNIAVVTITDLDGKNIESKYLLFHAWTTVCCSLSPSRRTSQWFCDSVWLWDKRYGSLLL